MIRVKLVLEGPTERDFVQKVLRPYVTEQSNNTVLLVPTVLITSVAAQTYRGGTAHDYQLVRRNVAYTLGEGGAEWVSSMLDVFRFPSKNRPWRVEPRPADPLAWVERLEDAFKNDIGDWRFRPYLCLHEFEALLFCSPEAIVNAVDALSPYLDEMKALLAAKPSPEHINDGPQTAPAKRLEAWAPKAYKKPLHGLEISRAIGVPAMRARCAHFNNWVEWLINPT